MKSLTKSGMIKCRNLKISLSLTNDLDLERVKHFRETNCSYLVYNNCNKCVITVYKHSMKSLHVTGICNKSDLHSIFYFVRVVLQNFISTGSIQNSLFSFKNCGKFINFNFKNVLKLFVNSIYSIKFNAEIFPALFLRPALKFKKMGFPTILLFTRGSYVIIGGKTIKYIKKAHNLVKNLLNNKLE